MIRLGLLLAKLLGAAPKEDRVGISMADDASWEITGIQDQSFPEFLTLLAALLPEGSVLYLEGTAKSAKDVINFLESHGDAKAAKITRGTIWPRPNFYHVPIEPDVMRALARLVGGHPTSEICSHLHAYKSDHVLLEWYDAFFQSLGISRHICEERVAEFCHRLRAKYRRLEQT
jgi:hypothetical protein